MLTLMYRIDHTLLAKIKKTDLNQFRCVTIKRWHNYYCHALQIWKIAMMISAIVAFSQLHICPENTDTFQNIVEIWYNRVTAFMMWPRIRRRNRISTIKHKIVPGHYHNKAQIKLTPFCRQHFQLQFVEWKCMNFEKHIEAETKWRQFCRRHFQVHLLELIFFKFRLKVHWCVSLRVQLTIFQPWFR